MKKILLIDTFNFFHRAYHALPSTLTDTKGNPTNAVYGTTSMLINIFDLIRPDYAVAALESEEKLVRIEEFEDYKAHREPMDKALEEQIPKMLEVIDAFGITMIQNVGHEADDVIGTFVKKFKNDYDIVIASNDKDLWQLIEGNVIVMLPKSKGEAEWLGEKEVKNRLGFDPKHLIDYKALRGDPSDNIPGVYGVGDVTARKLLAKYETIEEIYENLDEIKPKSLRDKLEKNREEAFMSKKLVTIVTDVPVGIDLEDCSYTGMDREKIKELFVKYNFKSLSKRLGFDEEQKKDSRQTSLGL